LCGSRRLHSSKFENAVLGLILAWNLRAQGRTQVEVHCAGGGLARERERERAPAPQRVHLIMVVMHDRHINDE
jgi:hypothetical protein